MLVKYLNKLKVRKVVYATLLNQGFNDVQLLADTIYKQQYNACFLTADYQLNLVTIVSNIYQSDIVKINIFKK